MGGSKKIQPYFLKALVAILGLLVVCLGIYILALPFYPEIKYQFWLKGKISDQAAQSLSQAQMLPLAENLDLGNRLIIPEIGVDIPIVDSANSSWALNRGAWRLPETSTPEQGSNTAIAGHRFKYLPPNNLTFYLLDKLQAGDGFVVIWSGKEYDYQVVGSKIVLPTEVSVLAPTEKPTLTLITCDPIFSQQNRLIVTAELVSK
jgi:LPXTG-site transpeptidase (sortase) family protein